MNREFEENGYCVYRNFFSYDLITIVSEYFKLKYQTSKYLNQVKSNLKEDVGESYSYYGDILCESILLSHGHKISKTLGLKLSPTYAFARVYENGDKLIPHIDRSSCEISATCPIFISDNKPSTIYISKYPAVSLALVSYEEVFSKPHNKVELHPGDVLFYKGCEYHHWRPPIINDYVCQFFMHAVQTEGKYNEYIYDTRPMMGLPLKYRQK